MRTSPRIAMALLVGGLLAAGNSSSNAPRAAEAAFAPRSSGARVSGDQEEEEEKPRQLKREGTQLVNVVGRFENEGDSATFVTKDGMEFGGLPNLGLERIIATLKSSEDPSGVWWNINGDVTEFAGKNYVLISRAVFKAAAPPPPPQAIVETN